MKKRTFSGINQLPKGDASDKITPGCIVLEGGAFRGIYGEGVLDAFMKHDINMQCTIGVSAGALNGLNYVAGHIGRAARINLGYRFDKRYVGLKALKQNHGLIGFNFLFDDTKDFYPFNEERFFQPEREFIAVVTDCNTGKPLYFRKDNCSDIYKAIQASASMPYVSKMVDVDGIPCLDGGCSDKIPYNWAIQRGFEKIIVVRTQTRSYRKKEDKTKSERMMKRMYRKYPEFESRLEKMDMDYNRQCDEIEELEKQGRILVIAPSKDLKVGRIEKDLEKLGRQYHLGYSDAEKRMEEIKKYLDIDS